MSTYLLTWNPGKWQWANIQDCITLINEHGFCSERWNIKARKKIDKGDRVFLMRLGQEPRGISASGWVASQAYEDEHWSDNSKTAWYVDVHFDTIIDPNQGTVFPIELLRQGDYANVNWPPRASGIVIPDNIAEQLEEDWARFLNRDPVKKIGYAEEISDEVLYYEGAVKRVNVNRYERDVEARAICIQKYGARCSVCGFDFGEKFGDIGRGFIHVHHLVPLSTIREGYEVDPIKDLRPICPNCHAMIHRKNPPYTIEELKTILRRSQ